MASGDGNRVIEGFKGAGWVLLAILFAPVALLALLLLGVQRLAVRVRGDFRPLIPTSPLDDSDLDDAAAAALAFVESLKLAVPGTVETVPDPDYWPPGEHDDMTLPHAIALTAPRLAGEQVLVSWDAPGGDLVRVEFPPLRAPVGFHDWYVGDGVSEVYWVAKGLLSQGARYAPNKTGRKRAWIHVPEAGGWTTLGVTAPKSSFEPDWYEHAPADGQQPD
ncbi:hypothetical protein PROP_03120 [Propionicimonas sp. T2.31MG-18]|uniref:hypothetical protein n=1 Tax=Propionicimonas sp. T2.31MG-18 TaxID=3157620 RepID=UPI0035EE4481